MIQASSFRTSNFEVRSHQLVNSTSGFQRPRGSVHQLATRHRPRNSPTTLPLFAVPRRTARGLDEGETAGEHAGAVFRRGEGEQDDNFEGEAEETEFKLRFLKMSYILIDKTFEKVGMVSLEIRELSSV